MSPPLLFWRQYLRRPLGIGGIAPSSVWLARAMVEALQPGQSGTVVELGPGTGAFTNRLLEEGVASERLVLVEFDADFVRYLRSAFRGLTVIQGDARRLPEILAGLGKTEVPCILSGLPLRSMAMPVRMDVGHAMARALAPGGRLVQFTYFNAPPLPAAAAIDLKVDRAGRVLRNLPPAYIWRYVKDAKRGGPAAP